MMQISTYGQSQGTLTGHIFSADERVDVRVGDLFHVQVSTMLKVEETKHFKLKITNIQLVLPNTMSLHATYFGV